LAESLTGDSFDEAKANAAAADRVQTTQRIEAAVVKALGRIHALLRADQRARLAYLLRTGALSI
jgi:Spy/CpxP family protein refolding chaperone